MYKVVETQNELEKALRVRYEVFTIGQGIDSKLDVDGKDVEATHLIALDGSEVVGTMRILIEGEKSLFQRLAILPDYRKNGYGYGLMSYAINLMKEQGIKEIIGHSQEYIVGLYKKLGFEVIGNPYTEVGIPHISIRMEL